MSCYELKTRREDGVSRLSEIASLQDQRVEPYPPYIIFCSGKRGSLEDDNL